MDTAPSFAFADEIEVAEGELLSLSPHIGAVEAVVVALVGLAVGFPIGRR